MDGQKPASCSGRKAYKDKGAGVILCAGMLFKIIYCIIMIVIFSHLNIKTGIITFSYVIWKEAVVNGIPVIKESDGYKFFHLDAFYYGQPEKRKEKDELFIKRIYPLPLAGLTVGMIVLWSGKIHLFSYEGYIVNTL